MIKILKLSIYIAFTVLMTNVYSQSNSFEFPKGIYSTFNDFINNIPSDTITKFYSKTGGNPISYRFYNTSTDKRIKKEFAFSDGDTLWLNIKEIIKRFPKSDKNQVKDDGNYFIKASQIGSVYICFEDYFTSKGAAFFGGIIAASASRRLKLIVYDKQNKIFDLFKNAEDFETFLKEYHPKYLKDLDGGNEKNPKRKKHIESLDKIREIMTAINNT